MPSIYIDDLEHRYPQAWDNMHLGCMACIWHMAWMGSNSPCGYGSREEAYEDCVYYGLFVSRRPQHGPEEERPRRVRPELSNPRASRRGRGSCILRDVPNRCRQRSCPCHEERPRRDTLWANPGAQRLRDAEQALVQQQLSSTQLIAPENTSWLEYTTTAASNAGTLTMTDVTNAIGSLQARDMRPTMRPTREQRQERAGVCRYCGHDLYPMPPSAATPDDQDRPFIWSTSPGGNNDICTQGAPLGGGTFNGHVLTSRYERDMQSRLHSIRVSEAYRRSGFDFAMDLCRMYAAEFEPMMTPDDVLEAARQDYRVRHNDGLAGATWLDIIEVVLRLSDIRVEAREGERNEEE